MIRKPSLIRRPVRAVLHLIPAGTAPGLVLIAAAISALIAANSPFHADYEAVLHRSLGPLSVHGWINDALMALFFFQVGLEVKRELVEGDLATPEARRIPVVAAICGMAVPALIYLASSGFSADLARGWAIPSATDIAFALGVLMLLGDRVPGSLKLLLVTIAIADDMGAIAIIAIGYTQSVDMVALACAIVPLAGLFWLNRRGVLAAWPYLALAALLWVAVYLSGIHATIAGVLSAMFLPLGKGEERDGPLERLEHGLAPLISYGVLPIFGFANAGVRFGEAPLFAPLPIAIMLGLAIGKQLGVFGALRAMSALSLGHRPEGTNWWHLYGLSLLAGIGFTMSLFISTLAFDDPVLIEEAKMGILLGSLLSAVAGFAVLRWAPSSPSSSDS